MKGNNSANFALNTAKKLKPLLIKCLPISLLRRVKKLFVNRAAKKLRNAPERLPFSRSANPDGVNLIGFVRGEMGLGQSCRLVAHGLSVADIPFTVYNYEQISTARQSDNTLKRDITNTTPYNVNIIHINPYELPLAYVRLGDEVWNRRYNIVYWLWELEKFPPEWESSLLLADEIWTPTEFVSKSIRGSTDKPICTIPYALSIPPLEGYGREHFNLPSDKILFLCMYDCSSVMERKNPLGAISAYKKAFADNSETGLVIKVNNPQEDELQRIQAELMGYPNIYIIAEVLEKSKLNALIACVDVYVSLHRAEGFGLVPAEAMLSGTPVVATNWSANTEFMNNNIACMVDYKLITIEKDCGHFRAGNRWADPDIHQAAEYMRRLNSDEDFRTDLSRKAKEHITKQFDPVIIAELMRSRILEIYKEYTS
ncbi:MAG: glycosyltransferase family 4 protein [Defluviitaleaceae bacterium]|nr:glycosyltransferase family 4 protein [Defluviitaleaceae bacterium]